MADFGDFNIELDNNDGDAQRAQATLSTQPEKKYGSAYQNPDVPIPNYGSSKN